MFIFKRNFLFLLKIFNFKRFPLIIKTLFFDFYNKFSTFKIYFKNQKIVVKMSLNLYNKKIYKFNIIQTK